MTLQLSNILLYLLLSLRQPIFHPFLYLLISKWIHYRQSIEVLMLAYFLLNVLIHIWVDYSGIPADIYLSLEVIIYADEGVEVVCQLLKLRTQSPHLLSQSQNWLTCTLQLRGLGSLCFPSQSIRTHRLKQLFEFTLRSWRGTLSCIAESSFAEYDSNCAGDLVRASRVVDSVCIFTIIEIIWKYRRVCIIVIEDNIFLRNTVKYFCLKNIIRFVKSLYDQAQSQNRKPLRWCRILQSS